MSQDTGKKKKFPINRPKTAFAMKANLVQREPQFQKVWEKQDLYGKMRNAPHPAGPFIFHDGPPYANGDIHLGHLLNKVLKDLVVRTRHMAGHDVHFIPGWDCHGLPIEHKVLKEQTQRHGVTESRSNDVMKTRYKCRDYAAKYVKLQARQMQRLGTVADYDNPYITMDPVYEAGVLEVFADLVGKGLVYRALKPVHWSIANQTALADAELEYEDREDTSVYVHFDLLEPGKLPAGLNAPQGEHVTLMIWTTTPWTLPANLAVAASAGALYGLYRYTDSHNKTRHVVLADALAEQVIAAGSGADATKLGDCTGSELAEAGIRYQHPFLDRINPLLTAGYVTLEDGTGLVHTAPGHGTEDFMTGQAHGLDTYCPVQEDGTFDDSAPQWLRGKDVWQANPLVIEQLKKSGHMHFDHTFMHSYPHDWRSKTPVIFRATDQWFISVDRQCNGGGSLQQRALDVTASDVQFIPEWGRNRMRGMLESRPDWCISRQRAWGLPIPAFYGPDAGQVLLTRASVQAAADKIREKGSDYWFTAGAADLLADYDPANDPDAPKWLRHGQFSDHANTLTKSNDIFDVWFESGSSWYACMVQRGLAREQGPVTDLYLEGSDQHRGWFQLSLLPCLGMRGVSPFQTVLTHGFMVDKDGAKMSKSGGNAIAVEDLLQDQGADVCRWWVSSLNYANDVKVDWEFFRLAGEEYRKVRNTIRFLLGNLGDFDPEKDRRELTPQDKPTLDGWAFGRLSMLLSAVRKEYDAYNFRKANELIYNFCNESLSAVYLAAVKDRLYCDKVDSDRRRRTQTVLYDIADALIRLVAPILVHTAEEAWSALKGEAAESVHLQPLPDAPAVQVDEHWQSVMELRDRVLKELEDARGRRGLDNPLDCGVEVACPPEVYKTLQPFIVDLADLCGVSRFVLDENGDETIGIEDLTAEPRCMRSWKRDGTVADYTDADGDVVSLSQRDAEALGLVQ